MLPAIIICTPLTRQYLINYARPLIYTTFMSFPALAAIKAVYTIMAQGRIDKLVNDLTTLIRILYVRLRALSDRQGALNCIEDLLEIPSDCPKSPIISLLTHDPRGLAQYCQNHGYIVRAIVAPTVPEGSERVRVCLHSGNTLDQIEGFVSTVQSWIEQQKQMRYSISETPAARL